jgi:hypothetical protein
MRTFSLCMLSSIDHMSELSRQSFGWVSQFGRIALKMCLPFLAQAQ